MGGGENGGGVRKLGGGRRWRGGGRWDPLKGGETGRRGGKGKLGRQEGGGGPIKMGGVCKGGEGPIKMGGVP